MAGAEQKIIDVKIKGVNDLLKLKKALKDLKDEQKKVTKVNKESEAEWKDKERAIDKATVKVRENRKALIAQTSAQKKSTKAGRSMGSSMLKTAATITAVISIVRVLSRVFVTAFKTFTEFEFSMAKVRAISGATNDEFMKLTESAKELGRTTFFTAKQVAELQVNFSKLGFSADEILKVQAATLDLSMATGSDLARAATVAGSAVRGFGLDASEAGRVVDVMAVSFTSSALDIEKWQTSMTKVSAIAASIGVDIEGTAAVMGALADTGIEASIAGTSLRNIFLKMSNPTEALAKRIGFTVSSTEDMIEALKILKKSQIGQLEMQSLVDKRQVIAMESMIKNVEEIEKYTTALNNAEGAGREMSAIMEETSKGAFKKFQSALEGLYLSLSERVAPAVNKLAEWMTTLAGSMTEVAEVRLSDKLRKDQKAMNDLFNAIRNNNTATKTAVSLVKKANRLYGEQLGYELEAIDNGEELYFSKLKNSQAQRELNAVFEDKIRLQAAEEVMNDAIAKDMANQYQLKLKALEISKLETKQKEEIAKFNALSDPNSDDFIKDAVERGEAMFQMAIPAAKLSRKIKLLKNEQEEMNKEMAEAPDYIAAARDLWISYGGIIDDITKPIECGTGYEWDDLLKRCVKEKKTKVTDFAEELNLYKISVSKRTTDTINSTFIEDEEDRNIAILNMTRDLLKEEFELFAVGDKRKAAAHLKYLKSIEKADKAVLNKKKRALDKDLRDALRRIDEEGRASTQGTLVMEKKSLEAKREALKKKLELYKNYSKEVKKILEQIEKVDEDLDDNGKERKEEAQKFAVDLAQELSNMTFSILSNQMAQEKSRREEDIQNGFNHEMTELDRQLDRKLISQADYDGKKMILETETQNEELALQKEFARKEKNIAIAQAAVNAALAITAAWVSPYTAPFVIPLIIASTAAQIAVIESQEFAKGGMVEEYANGGMVQGKSHAQGGEKFAVGGRVVELEGGEAVINKRSTAMFRPQLSAMNSAGGGVKFADGGIMSSSSFTSARFNSLSLGGSQSSGRVVVVESDITNSQSKVKAIQSNASF